VVFDTVTVIVGKQLVLVQLELICKNRSLI